MTWSFVLASAAHHGRGAPSGRRMPTEARAIDEGMTEGGCARARGGRG